MSLSEAIISKILESVGVSKETVDKIKTMIDNVDIKETDTELTISVNLKNINITIKK